MGPGKQEIDATGKFVMPGGIDSHCHIDQRSSGGGRNAETFLSGTRSAACGGTTTIICFAAQEKANVNANSRRLSRACERFLYRL